MSELYNFSPTNFDFVFSCQVDGTGIKEMIRLSHDGHLTMTDAGKKALASYLQGPDGQWLIDVLRKVFEEKPASRQREP